METLNVDPKTAIIVATGPKTDMDAQAVSSRNQLDQYLVQSIYPLNQWGETDHIFVNNIGSTVTDQRYI